jgi:Asp-tRNA(Asn)/Glu-tRNA(Gln) amidotransferase B subunit
MLMFSIHKTRKDWDPLPTALKLKDLEDEFRRRNKRKPTEVELASLASLSRGEVRRLKKLLALPEEYRRELLNELKRPYSEQRLTVDHVLEATKAAEALRKRQVIDETETAQLTRAIVDKFKREIITNTVAPRRLARLARAVERREIPRTIAHEVVARLIHDPGFTIDQAYQETVERTDFQHGIEQLCDRLLVRLEEHRQKRYQVGESLRPKLDLLLKSIRSALGE